MFLKKIKTRVTRSKSQVKKVKTKTFATPQVASRAARPAARARRHTGVSKSRSLKATLVRTLCTIVHALQQATVKSTLCNAKTTELVTAQAEDRQLHLQRGGSVLNVLDSEAGPAGRLQQIAANSVQVCLQEKSLRHHDAAETNKRNLINKNKNKKT